MTDILKRDITGKCEGECRDCVREGEEERQDEIKGSDVNAPKSYPDAHWARSRNEQPALGGGVTCKSGVITSCNFNLS
jgi:hypothetical protein